MNNWQLDFASFTPITPVTGYRWDAYCRKSVVKTMLTKSPVSVCRETNGKLAAHLAQMKLLLLVLFGFVESLMSQSGHLSTLLYAVDFLQDYTTFLVEM